jgi:hypothetical protein
LIPDDVIDKILPAALLPSGSTQHLKDMSTRINSEVGEVNATLQPTYLLTYLLTPWSRVLLEKLTGFAVNQEIPRILWNPKVHYLIHKRTPPVPILSPYKLHVMEVLKFGSFNGVEPSEPL